MLSLGGNAADLPPHLRVLQTTPPVAIPTSSAGGVPISLTSGTLPPDVTQVARTLPATKETQILPLTTQVQYLPVNDQDRVLFATSPTPAATTQQWKAALQAHLHKYQKSYAPSHTSVLPTASTLAAEPRPISTTPKMLDLEGGQREGPLDTVGENTKSQAVQPTISTLKLTRTHLEALERMTVSTNFPVSTVDSESTTQTINRPILHTGKARERLAPLQAPHSEQSKARTSSHQGEIRRGDRASKMSNKIIPETAKMSKSHPCPYDNCLLGFDNITALIRHKTERHDYCKKCSMDFKDFQDYLNHKIESSEHITCPVCGEDFRSSGGRDKHIITMHPNPQDLVCPGCSDRFIRAGSLIDHIEKSKCSRISIEQFERYRAVNAIREAHLTTLADEDDDVGIRFVGSEVTNSVGGVDIPPDKKADYEESFPSLIPASKPAGNDIGTLDRVRSPLTSVHDIVAIVSPLHSVEDLHLGIGEGNSALDVMKDPSIQPNAQEKHPAWTRAGSASKTLFPEPNKQDVPQIKDLKGQATPRYSNHDLADMVTGSVSSSPGLCFANGEPVEAINPQSSQFNPEAFKDVLGRYKCPYPRCGKNFPVRNNFVAHLNSSAHKGVEHRCPECLRIFKDATALTQHMEASTSRCKIKDSSNFGKIMSMVSGGIISVEGQYVDGTVRYEAAEPEW